jgi:hypothetical protein
VNLVQNLGSDGEYALTPEPLPEIPDDLAALLQEDAH